MFMFGVVAMAAGVQAASFNWTTSSKAWGVNSTDLASGLADGTTYNVGTKNADTMSNQITANSATWMYTLILTDASDTTKTDTLTGSLTASSFNSRAINLTLSSDMVVAGSDLTYSIVFTGNVTDGNSKAWDVTSNEITGSWHVNDMGDISLDTAAASSFATPGGSDIPEPTSGLLLAIGGAMLALRRRRA